MSEWQGHILSCQTLVWTAKKMHSFPKHYWDWDKTWCAFPSLNAPEGMKKIVSNLRSKFISEEVNVKYMSEWKSYCYLNTTLVNLFFWWAHFHFFSASMLTITWIECNWFILVGFECGPIFAMQRQVYHIKFINSDRSSPRCKVSLHIYVAVGTVSVSERTPKLHVHNGS